MRTNPPEAGFMGLSVETDLDRIDAAVAILGVPHGWPYPNAGSTAAGCAGAPAAVRRASQRLARFLGHWDFDLEAPMDLRSAVDAGDVPGEASDGTGNSARTTDAVRSILAAGAIPICIGGDDSVPIPILRAYEDRGPITVLQMDAHLDYRDEVDGVREGYSSPMRRASEMPHVERIIHVGLRGLGSARTTDVEDSRAAGNLLVSARELHEHGTGWLLEQIPREASVFVSLDFDGLDPSTFPAVSAMAPGGLTYLQAGELLAGVASRTAGVAVTEFVPGRDLGDISVTVATRLVARLAATLGRPDSWSRRRYSRS